MNSAENVSERVKHIKRGTTYTTEAAAFQVSVPDEMPAGVTNHLKGRVVLDGETIITYRDEASGKLYARFPDEFTPDRFQALRSPPTEDGDRVEVGEWMVVPREPTREMWAAMGTAVTGYYNKHHDIVAGEVYRAMLSASPRPETVGVSDAVVERIYEAVLACSHRITHDEVTLYHDDFKHGKNALAQLHTRLTAALSVASHETGDGETAEKLADILNGAHQRTAAEISDAVLTWMVEHGWLDAEGEYDASDVLTALDGNALSATRTAVKPLEWKGPGDEDVSYGDQGGLSYTVRPPNRTPGWRVWVTLKSFDGITASIGGLIVTVKAESREAAFAAAQADYERRILSTRPATEVKAEEAKP